MEVSQKTKNRTALLPSNPTPRDIPEKKKKKKKHRFERYIYTMFIVALFIIAKIWKQPKCLSTDE